MRTRIVLLFIAFAAASAAVAETADIKVGDSWTFDEMNAYNKKLLNTYRIEVTGVSDSGIATHVTDNAGTVTSERFGHNWDPISTGWPETRTYEFSPAYTEFPARLDPGVKWQGRTVARDPRTGREMKMKYYGTVTGNERIRVPAGEFDTIKLSIETVLDDADFWRHRTHVIDYEWYSPKLGHVVRRETHSSFFENTGMHPVEHSGDWTIFELTAYKVN